MTQKQADQLKAKNMTIEFYKKLIEELLAPLAEYWDGLRVVRVTYENGISIEGYTEFKVCATAVFLGSLSHIKPLVVFSESVTDYPDRFPLSNKIGFEDLKLRACERLLSAIMCNGFEPTYQRTIEFCRLQFILSDPIAKDRKYPVSSNESFSSPNGKLGLIGEISPK
jgi:hypothetical protein